MNFCEGDLDRMFFHLIYPQKALGVVVGSNSKHLQYLVCVRCCSKHFTLWGENKSSFQMQKMQKLRHRGSVSCSSVNSRQGTGVGIWTKQHITAPCTYLLVSINGFAYWPSLSVEHLVSWYHVGQMNLH